MEREVSGDTYSNLVYSYADVIGVALSIYDYHTSAILPLIRGPLFLVFIVFFFFFLTLHLSIFLSCVSSFSASVKTSFES